MHGGPADKQSRVSPVGRIRLDRIVYAILLGFFLCLLLTIDFFEIRNSFFAWDFRAFYEGGRDYLHLRSPYISGSLADLTTRQNFVYPLPTAALLAPVSLIPYHLASALFVVLSGVLLVAAVYMVGVRDPRCYCAVLIGAPAFDGLQIGTISPILVFVLAVIWRYRDKAWVASLALSILVLTKIFLWPLAVWLLATRRARSVIGAAVTSGSAFVLATLPLGFGVLTQYPSLLRSVSGFEGSSSLSLVTLGSTIAGSATLGYTLSIVAGGLLLGGVVWSGGRTNDSLAFRLAVLASLALTPIVWNHYLVLLFVPLALIRQRFSPLWLGTAWVIGPLAGTARGAALAILIGSVWVVALMQAGVIRPPHAPLPIRTIAPAALLCACLVTALAVVLPVVPAVAALRPLDGSDSRSGTAVVRLLHGRKVCLQVRTNDVPRPAIAQVVEPNVGAVLLTLPVHAAETCGRYMRTVERRELASAFAKHDVSLVLRVVSGSNVVLSGEIVRLQDSTG